MKFLLVVAGLLLAAVVGRTVMVARGNRLLERNMGALATLQLPARLEPWEPTTNWLGTQFRLTRLIRTFLPGGNPTYHEELEVTQLVPDQVHRLGARALTFLHGPFRSLEGMTWEEPIPVGSTIVQHGRARYRMGSLDEPAHLLRVLDPSRALALSYRMLERQGTRQDAMVVAERALATYRVVTSVDEHFAAIDRDLGGGIHLALPVEFFEPFMMEVDTTGVQWMRYRYHPDAAPDPAVLEQVLLIAAFFAPGHAEAEAVARDIVAREASAETSMRVPAEPERAGMEVSQVHHLLPDREEPAWLVVAVDGPRGVAIALRRWQRDAARAEAVAVVERAIASYRRDNGTR